MNEQLDKRTVVAASRVKYNDGYMPGFGNDFETEAMPGALPVGVQLLAPTGRDGLLLQVARGLEAERGPYRWPTPAAAEGGEAGP